MANRHERRAAKARAAKARGEIPEFEGMSERREAKARAALARGEIPEEMIEIQTWTGVAIPDTVDEALEDYRRNAENFNGCKGFNMEFTFYAGDRAYTACPASDMDLSLLIDGLRALIIQFAATMYTFAIQGVTDDSNHQEVFILGAVDGNGVHKSGVFEIKRDRKGRVSLHNWRIFETKGWADELFGPPLGTTAH